MVNVVNQVSFKKMIESFEVNIYSLSLVNRPRTCSPSPCGENGKCILTTDGYKCLCNNSTTGVLCEQKLMPKNYRWCPLDCQGGTTCLYEGTTPKCRAI